MVCRFDCTMGSFTGAGTRQYIWCCRSCRSQGAQHSTRLLARRLAWGSRSHCESQYTLAPKNNVPPMSAKVLCKQAHKRFGWPATPCGTVYTSAGFAQGQLSCCCSIRRTVAMTTVGSALCYWGSRTYAGPMLVAYLPDRLSVLRPLVATAKSRGGTLVLPMIVSAYCFIGSACHRLIMHV